MKDKREQLIHEAASKEVGDPAWRDRLEEWIELNKPKPYKFLTCKEFFDLEASYSA